MKKRVSEAVSSLMLTIIFFIQKNLSPSFSKLLPFLVLASTLALSSEAYVPGSCLGVEPTTSTRWSVVNNTFCMNTEIVINGVLDIPVSSNLTLKNVTLIFNESGTQLNNSGFLALSNSTIRTDSSSVGFVFVNWEASFLNISRSTILHAGIGSQDGYGINNGIVLYGRALLDDIMVATINGTNTWGIYASSTSNIIITNAHVHSFGQSSHGILLESVENGTIANVTVLSDGTDNLFGIVLDSSTSVVVANSTVNVTAAGSTGVAVAARWGGNNIFQDNTVVTSGFESNWGMYLEDETSSALRGNNVTATGDSDFNYGIYIFQSTDANLSQNSVATLGDSNNYGIFIDRSSSSSLAFSNISAVGTVSDNYGLYLDSSDASLILENSIVTNGSSGNAGVFLFASPGTQFQGLNITSQGWLSNNHGIWIQDTSQVAINATQLSSSGNASHGIYVLGNSDHINLSSVGVSSLSSLSYGLLLSGNGVSTPDNLRWVDGNISAASSLRIEAGNSQSMTTLINVSFDKQTLSFGSSPSGSLNVTWKLRFFTNSTTDSPLANVSVNVTQGSRTVSLPTTENGFSSFSSVTEFVRNATVIINTSSYNVTAHRSGFDPHASVLLITQSGTESLTLRPSAPPILSSISPNSSLIVYSGEIVELSMNVTDPSGLLGSNATLISPLGSNATVTMTDVGNSTFRGNVSLSGAGRHTVILSASDLYGNANTSTINITVRSPILINSVEVLPRTKHQATSLNISINVSSDNLSGSVTCQFGGETNGTLTLSAGSHQTGSIVIGNYSVGLHAFNVSCDDGVRSSNHTTGTFTVALPTYPDLEIFSGLIYVSNGHPEINETISVYVDAINVGLEEAHAILVEVIVAGESLCNSTIQSLPGYGSRAPTAPCEFRMNTSGTKILQVRLDANNSIIESDEDNNEATYPIMHLHDIGEGILVNSSIDPVVVLEGETFSFHALASYLEVPELVKGAQVTFMYSGTNISSGGWTSPDGEISFLNIDPGSAGNYTLLATVDDHVLYGTFNGSIEVLPRPVVEENASTDDVPGVLLSCPYSFPLEDPAISALLPLANQCVEDVECLFNITVTNNGCPDTDSVAVSLEDFMLGTVLDSDRYDVGGESGQITWPASFIPDRSGQFMVGARVDRDNEITELSEANNIRFILIDVYPDQSDLQVRSATLASPLSVGEPGNITLLIANGGGRNVTSSFNVQVNLDGAVIQQYRHNASVPAFAGTVSVTLTLQVNDTQAHNVSFVLDSQSEITEILESNNNYSLSVRALQSADLHLSSVSVPSAVLLGGDVIELNMTVENIGNLNVTLPFAVETTFNGTLANTTVIGNLSSRTLRTVSGIRVNLTALGEQVLTVCIDPDDEIAEGGFGGINCISQTLSVLAPGVPDLKVSLASAQPTRSILFLNEPVFVSLNVSNRGFGIADNATLNVNITLNGTFIHTASFVVPALAPNTSTVVVLNYTPSSFGTLNLRTMIDANNTYQEGSEGDNIYNLGHTVVHPDLRISSPDIFFGSATTTVGEPVMITIIAHDDTPFDSHNVSVNVSSGGSVVASGVIRKVPALLSNAIVLNFTPNTTGTKVLSVSVNEPHVSKEYGSKTNNLATSAIIVLACSDCSGGGGRGGRRGTPVLLEPIAQPSLDQDYSSPDGVRDSVEESSSVKSSTGVAESPGLLSRSESEVKGGSHLSVRFIKMNSVDIVIIALLVSLVLVVWSYLRSWT